MGSVTYNFLLNSILFNDDEIEREFSTFNDSQLENLLQDYREHCLTNYADLLNEIKSNNSTLKVLSSIEEIPFDTLLQSALYFDQYVIYDPLFKFTNLEGETSKVVSSFLGFDKKAINRKELVKTLKLLKKLTPMISADYIKMLPISYSFEPPKETPINFPINYYADILPNDIMKYFKERVIVNSMKKVSTRWEILDKQDYTSGLFITFKDFNNDKGLMYNYLYPKVIKSDDLNKVSITLNYGDYPMDIATWELWVKQSVHSSAKAIFDKIYLENLIACDLKATYLTDNSFTANLLTQNMSVKETIEISSSSQFMNLKLPFLDMVDINKLMTIRKYEAELFTNFRIELEKHLRELRILDDPKEIKLLQENIIHELGTVQVHKINQKFDSLKRKGIIDGALLLGGLAGTVQTAGWSLMSSALAVFSGYNSYREYKDKLVENPSYLLWKVLKR